MTVAEAAKKMSISRSKLYQLASQHKISHYRIGGKIVFEVEDVAAFLAGCRIASTPSSTPESAPRLKLKHINLSGGS